MHNKCQRKVTFEHSLSLLGFLGIRDNSELQAVVTEVEDVRPGWKKLQVRTRDKLGFPPALSCHLSLQYPSYHA